MAKIKITVERINGYCNMPLLVGDYFFVEDSRLTVPDGGHVCMWALQSMMPVFLILNERDKLEDGHWVKVVDQFSCPNLNSFFSESGELFKQEEGSIHS